MLTPRRFVVIGLSISSSWGNTHAATYRSVLGAMARRGHDVLFLERHLPWYAAHRDLNDWDSVRVGFYDSLDDLARQYRSAVRAADVVIVGSNVPEGSEALDWVRRNVVGVLMFYDIDTPLTVARLEAGEPCDYLRRDQLTRLDTVLSFAAGFALDRLELLGAPRARALCGSIDPGVHLPVAGATRWDLGYLGDYAACRQPALSGSCSMSHEDGPPHGSSSPARSTPRRWPGPPTSTISSTCRHARTPTSTAANVSRSTSVAPMRVAPGGRQASASSKRPPAAPP